MGFIKTIESSEFNLPKKNDFIINAAIQAKVAGIIQGVIVGGDTALLQYTASFDNVQLSSPRVPLEQIKSAGDNLDPSIRTILENSISNIREFHQKQIGVSWEEELEDGTKLGQLVRPIDRAGIYIPGGRAAYPSTLIMNAIPAQLAGVPSIAVVSPPGKNGLPHNLILAAAAMLGLDEVYAVGGAQSIAALAFGTESIAPVYKITGPGNQYVAEAKRQVFGKVGIDSIAGPSEILILHDDPSVPCEYIVYDLLSQAEHDPEAQSILITTHRETAEKVAQMLDELIPRLPRREIIQASIEAKGLIVLVETIEEGIKISNHIAPEHLELLLEDESKIPLVRNAGAIFIGKWSAETVGDYFAGPNHTIPTNGAARYASPLGVADFQKHSSMINYSHARLMKEGKMIAEFADLEELNAHAEAIRVRLGE